MSCPDCFKGSILAGEPVGQFVKEVENAYFSPATSDKNKDKAVVLFTDIFGLPLNNSKVIADSLAKRLDCDVWVPDQFDGKPPIPVDKMDGPDRAGQPFSMWKFALKMLPLAPKLFANRAAVVDGRVKKFFAKLKQEKPQYRKIGAVGYCFGGATAVRFGSSDYVQSIVVCHPGPISDSEVKAIKVPCSWVCAQDDFTFPPEKRARVEAELKTRKEKNLKNAVDYEFKIHAGTAHGFACRPNFKYEDVKQAFHDAMDQIVGWFEKTVILNSTETADTSVPLSVPAVEASPSGEEAEGPLAEAVSS